MIELRRNHSGLNIEPRNQKSQTALTDTYINISSVVSLPDLTEDRSKPRTAMELSQSKATELAQATTVSIFNERDVSKRRQLMEKYFSPKITCFQPGSAASGYDNIDETFKNLHSGGMADFDFSIVGPVWVNHNLVFANWEYGPGGKAGEVGMRGSDIIIVGQDEKVSTLYAMIEGANTIQ